MAGVLTIELPKQEKQTEFNLRRWAELCADAQLGKYTGKIETDRFGHIVMMPPAAPFHSSFQAKITGLLQDLMPKGEVLTECAISTADGVKAADIAWASAQRVKELGNYSCFPKAPEICVEVISPRNTKKPPSTSTLAPRKSGFAPLPG
jgi:Uma2 family endonuclease